MPTSAKKEPLMPAGRPTEYTQEVVDKAYAYLSDDDDVNYKSYDHAIPSIVGLCRVLNRARTTLYRWAEEEDNEFKYILEQSNEFQEFTTVNGTLKNELNAQIGKLILGKHGYHDKQDTTVKGNIGLTDLSEDELDRKLHALESKHEQSTKD